MRLSEEKYRAAMVAIAGIDLIATLAKLILG